MNRIIESQLMTARSLPPLVEGKIHGYLKCTIDEVVWTRRNPGNVIILSCWWGESDNLVFRPMSAKIDSTKSDKDITQTYAIKTNLALFREYLRNSETVELTILTDKFHQEIGKAHITNLLAIFSDKCFSQYYPIHNDHGYKIGEVHVVLKLMTIHRSLGSRSKFNTFANAKTDMDILLTELPTTHSTIFPSNVRINSERSYSHRSMPLRNRIIEPNGNVFKSGPLDEHQYFNNATPEMNSGVTDKLVAQVVARAQKLRGEIFSDTSEDNLSICNENSTSNIIDSGRSAGNETALHEYFMGKRMSRHNEKRALETLRSYSPTPSLIEMATATIRTCNGKSSLSPIKSSIPDDKPVGDISDIAAISGKQIDIQCKQASPIDYVDSLRVIVDSLTLNSAGYRRVQSSNLSRSDGVPMSVTYFVQYDLIFGDVKKFSKRMNNGSKPVKMSSKKQTGQMIHFNHDTVHDLPQTYLHMDVPLKFKVYYRHLNQRTPSELGVASIYVNEAARTPHLCSTQRLAIVKKDIKIGELKVTVELGCDRIHFGKQFVEAVTSAKENIPVLELSTKSYKISSRYNNTSGDQSKSDDKTATVPERCETVRNTTQFNTTDRKFDEGSPRNDERVIKEGVSNLFRDKTLLHALIYIKEGKNLPVLNTYLICRAFWRENRASSRICTSTNNPFYHFHQLIPLIYDQELLNRTKDNCIIAEVYSKNPTSDDNLLGIAKLSVHQLYIAYRDPLVVPHLLESKYPVTSVDGWIPITDPVTGALRGELLALVALGSADQIALLEMTRGLRDPLLTSHASQEYMNNTSHGIHGNSSASHIYTLHSENMNVDVRTEHIRNARGPTHSLSNVQSPDMKTQECQTEISTVSDFKTHETDEVNFQREDQPVLHAIVNRLAHASNVPKANKDQGAQTELEFSTRNTSQEKMDHACDVEELCLDASNSNSFSGDSYDSPRENFDMPREVFRSVGVGAEFDDPLDQVPSTNHGQLRNSNCETFNDTQCSESTRHIEARVQRDSIETGRILQSPSHNRQDIGVDLPIAEEATFRAIVGIECALHLPKIRIADKLREPSTYVTFQKTRENDTSRIDAYMTTNICPYTCNPQYEWSSDTTLSKDLLTKGEKRLIMKVWCVVEPHVNMEINLKKDVVIGFSAIDLSVLAAGFPMISGWFHIIDFSGKCNGQMKISVTPLETLSPSGRLTSIPSPTGIVPINRSDHSSRNLQNIQVSDENVDINTVVENLEGKIINEGEIDNKPLIDIDLNLGDASMSFLSSSLKQKLGELDEIKKRLQSRLQDITDTAFDDDFENDFDLVDHENGQDGGDKNGNDHASQSSQTVLRYVEQPNELHIIATESILSNENEHHFPPTASDNRISAESIETETGYSKNTVACSDRTLENGIHHRNNKMGITQQRTDIIYGKNVDGTLSSSRDLNGHAYECDSRGTRINLCDHHLDESQSEHHGNMDVDNHIINEQNSDSGVAMSDDHYVIRNAPIQGTRVHINHLLDKLSTQLTVAPPPIVNLPMKRNIMELITSLRRNNNNFSNNIKCNREANVRTVLTQTDINYVHDSFSQIDPIRHVDDTTSNDDNSVRNDGEVPAKNQRKGRISTVIRDELIADDHNDPIDYDFLSTRLITSNVRHMASHTAFNPLLYPHILPELSDPENECQNDDRQNLTSLPSGSPEGEAVEQLDSRYVETFNATINKGLSRLRDTTDMESSSSRIPHRLSSPIDNTAIFRVTPTGVSENIDGNIDVTVMHRQCNDDLMSSNSIESTTTISIGNDMQTVTEIDDHSSLNSLETPVAAVSRQAPDGGNPAEDPGKFSSSNSQNHLQSSPSSDS